MKIKDFQTESWSEKYKNSINCSHPKGFSQRAHCAGKKKHNESVEMEMVCEDCGMCKSHGSLNEIRKGQKDSNGYTRCWPGKHAEGTKKGKNGGQVRNCVPNESVAEADMSRRGFLGALAGAGLAAAGLGASGNAQAGTNDAAFFNKVNDLHQKTAQTNPRYAKEHASLNIGIVRGMSGASAENNKQWAQKTAQLLQKYGVAVNESVVEGEQRVDSLVTDALKIMQGSEVTDAVQALKTVLGDREYNGRRGHYNFYIRQIMDMYNQQGLAEDFNGEYDDEAGMVKNNLHTIIRVLTHLGKDIDNNENFPEWVQEKIAMIKQTSVEVMNYMISQHKMDVDPEVEEMYEAMDQLAEEMAAKKGISADLVWESFEALDDHMLYETAAWRRKEGKSKKGGLNAKGVASYRREHPGSKLQTAVTTKPSKLKPGSKAAKRRKSFCARMSGVKGPAKKPNGEPTRKTLALRKWNC